MLCVRWFVMTETKIQPANALPEQPTDSTETKQTHSSFLSAVCLVLRVSYSVPQLNTKRPVYQSLQVLQVLLEVFIHLKLNTLSL